MNPVHPETGLGVEAESIAADEIDEVLIDDTDLVLPSVPIVDIA